MEEKENLEIVSGNGSNLNISPVHEHIKTSKHTNEKPKNVVVPKENQKQQSSKKKNTKNSENE